MLDYGAGPMQTVLVRTLVLDCLSRVLERGELADHALDRALRANKALHSRERRLVGECLFALVRQRRSLAYRLEAHLGRRWQQLSTPDRDRWALALAAHETAGLSAADGLTLAGLDRADTSRLQAVAQAETRWPSDPLTALAVRRSLPEALAQRFVDALGDEADGCLEAMGHRAPLALRTNLLKGTPEQLIEKLAAEGVAAQPGQLSPWAVVLEGRPNVFGLAAYKEGWFEVQDEGSQLIALASQARPGGKVIDACAGGGGKTLALGAAMANKGSLWACDISTARLADVAPRARRAGLFCFRTLVAPPTPEGDVALKPHEGRNDVVLVDAPCSGTGAWRRNPDARWRLTTEQLEAFPALQLEILRRYARLVRPGGRIVYATCSVLPEENERVVESFLADGGFVLEPASVPASARDGDFLRLYPHRHGTDGFFGAVMRRAPKA